MLDKYRKNQEAIATVQVGDRARCRRGIVGTITHFTDFQGFRIAKGKTDEGANWQSVRPEKV